MSNLSKRALSGTAYVFVFISCILYGPISFFILIALTTTLALNEFNNLVTTHLAVPVNRTITTISGVYLFIATFYVCQGVTGFIEYLPYLISLLFLFISELYLKHTQPFAVWAYSFAGQVYIALPFALLNLLAYHSEEGYSGILPLAVFVFLWLNDTGAYCFGSLLHKKIPYKLFERISPHKSWIGSIGGALVVLCSSVAFAHFYSSLTCLQWVGLALVVTVFGTWGDLVESLIKRQLHLKDSGNFLPGHGGVLDRFDSALLAIPASVIYVYSIPYLF